MKFRVGMPVTVNTRPAQRGVFTITKLLPKGRVHVRRQDGLVLNAPTDCLRLLNPWPVELEAVVYREAKGSGKRASYEHTFEGKRPRLTWDGKNLRIARSGSRYRVDGGWIHG
jgi:hypothetical protein